MALPLQIDLNEATGISAVTVDIPVDASAAFVWDVVRDIYAVHKRLIPGAAVAVDQEPDTRIVTFADGMKATERVLELNDDARRLVYQTTEDAPATHHLGTQVVREDDTGVYLVWTTEFAPASLHDWVTSLMNEFAELMKKTLDAAYASQL
ncbi:SRPBCC family protein [Streptomyces sp. ME18-1-4]|uniref:SRPBCC family protein n=1 Tax=Streptomyces sp. ME18-1-4 TaxID=3028685 RepID=UPI0029B053FC|nr:SRPBCC family protein [Streptomyces sp. ME18-1-4]MDX3247912.1 SRPBCC family protein [Streptomyces sp. ME18-1-4]